jgi:hypothetical protein
LTQPTTLTDYDGVAVGYITSDVAGVYNVIAYDTTYAEKDIKIKASEDAIFVAEGIPILYTEPKYTQGYSNTLQWEALSNAVEYYIECSLDEDFETVDFNSGWTASTQYEFTGLESGTKYYYRVKGRNESGAGTLWSNIVFSTQDATPPKSEVINVNKSQTGFDLTIESSDDVGEVALVDIYVKMDDGEWVLIKSTELDEVTIEFDEIEGFDVENKPERICFYSRAEDTVGNLENFDPKDTGDYCVGYGLTLQNIVDLVGKVADTVTVTANQYLNRGVNKLADIVSQNTVLFTIFLFIPLLVYMLIWMYKNNFRLSDTGMWLELWNGRLFPRLLAEDESRPIGVVYDSTTREPIRDVVVSLIRKGEVRQLSVTDKIGVFRFSPKDSKYELGFWKSGYEFPSKTVKDTKDEIFNFLYLGGAVAMPKDKNKLIGVPVDYKGDKNNIFSWTVDFFLDILKFVNPLLIVLAIAVSFILNILYETNIYYILVILYIILLAASLGFFNLVRKSWGIVRDQEGRRISGVRVGIYNKKFNRLIDFRVTDDKGRFRFVVPPGEYILKPVGDDYEIAGGKEGIEVNLGKGKMIEVTAVLTVSRL